MASSRIFIKGLPPTFTESDLKAHFSKWVITDAKLYPGRRIAFVGLKTPEDAQKAVKYFNKTFIKMSRIGVELARPVQDPHSGTTNGTAPTARKGSGQHDLPSAENVLKRKREGTNEDQQDPKLKEFLNVMKPKSKRKALEDTGADLQTEANAISNEEPTVATAASESDSEYEAVPQKVKRARKEAEPVVAETEGLPALVLGTSANAELEPEPAEPAEPNEDAGEGGRPTVSDSDWARSRTSRLLGLLDDEEEDATAKPVDEHASVSSDDEQEPEKGAAKEIHVPEAENGIPTPSLDNGAEDVADPVAEAHSEHTGTMRLFVRNLSYDVKEEDLESEFESYGNLEEVHVARDSKTGAAKGFAYLQFSDPDSAEAAMRERDGQTFQGRLLHILPARQKRETKLDEFALSKLPLKKQQQVRKRREAASTTFNWNALYMNADAVVSSVANRLGLSKSEMLDPTSSDAAVKQAHAETHIIQETKAYFKQHGIDLDAFKKSQRGDTAILVKNIPYDCSRDELKRLFEEHGELRKFLMPPSGVIAIIEYPNAAQCKAAFGALAYRKIKSSVLFLEKAPKGLFDATAKQMIHADGAIGISKTSAADLKDIDHAIPDTAGTATLYVRNLNFTTTTKQLTDVFKPLEGLISARVKTKSDPKKPGQVLSMGYGFLEFRNQQQAQSALKAMDGYDLDGHKLQIRASHKGIDAAEERRKADTEKRAAGRKTKIVIKNLPFEAGKEQVRELFGAYGQLRSIRVPKKIDRTARGFAFADFTTPKEAESAIDTLRGTHFYGRRLVLDFAAEDPEDAEAEIEKMQQKVGAQVNKVALQKLTSGGRKKFSTQNDEDGGD